MLSAKQQRLIEEVVCGTATRIIASGVARSGKTLAGSIALARLAAIKPGKYLIAAPFMPQVYGILSEMRSLYGDELVERRNEKKAFLFGSEFALYSGHDAGAEMALRSATFNGALLDEAVGLHPDFLEQVLIRCSRLPMLVVAMTNPDHPYHDLKVKWIDEAKTNADYTYVPFGVGDNPSNPDGYYERMERDLSGAMKARMLYGEWSMAAGSIYGSPSAWSAAPSGRPVRRYLGVDYGHRSPSHAVLVVERRQEDGSLVRFVEREWRHEGVDDEGMGDVDMTINAKARALMLALGPVDAVFVDPNAPALIDALGRQGAPVRKAVNDVAVGIEQVQRAFEDGLLFVNADACPKTVGELAGYSYDHRAQSRLGKDVPLKNNDHACDAVRYAIASAGWETEDAGESGVLDLRRRR